MYRPNGDRRPTLAESWAGDAFCRGFLRFNNKGTHKTPRERCIMMHILGGYPTGRTAVMLGADWGLAAFTLRRCGRDP
jgi:hypothetical protein